MTQGGRARGQTRTSFARRLPVGEAPPRSAGGSLRPAERRRTRRGPAGVRRCTGHRDAIPGREDGGETIKNARAAENGHLGRLHGLPHLLGQRVGRVVAEGLGLGAGALAILIAPGGRTRVGAVIYCSVGLVRGDDEAASAARHQQRAGQYGSVAGCRRPLSSGSSGAGRLAGWAQDGCLPLSFGWGAGAGAVTGARARSGGAVPADRPAGFPSSTCLLCGRR
jgi:hypothetical protein